MNLRFLNAVTQLSMALSVLLLEQFVNVRGSRCWCYSLSLKSFAAGTVPNAICTTGKTQLQLTSENVTGNSLEGRLEVCVNNAWGTVCDSLFGSEDAAVACSGLSGFSQQGKTVPVPVPVRL